ncbi:MAG: DNA-directed RNA polymerase subunit omega [Thermodesulfobacteriota bacterium]|nr:DNA-directed RNA polymerase subunit omega [Thermodesulfobacteriota bacterium]
MARVTIEDCLRQEENRFVLVHMAAKRVRQLIKGSRTLVHAPDNRAVVLALREIAASKVSKENKENQSNDHPEKTEKEEQNSE